jgi:hypothetical protein
VHAGDARRGREPPQRHARAGGRVATIRAVEACRLHRACELSSSAARRRRRARC